MKKYRTLVTGKNELIIDDMFVQLHDTFDLLCCSSRYEDRSRHIDFVKPEIFIICLKGETPDEMTGLSDLKRKITSLGIITVVIGSEEECAQFQMRAVQMADLILTRPINAARIKTEVLNLIDKLNREKEEQARMMAALEELKKKDEKKHILIVDDDPTMLKLVKEYLSDEKYVVATAVSGKIAHKFLETRETNLIFLDYEMPEENGVEVLKWIREHDNLSNIPVVFLTGITDKSKLMEALSMKPQGYLLKPIDREKLLGTVEKFIG